MRICVVGMGKLGLPLAVQFSSKGFNVIGLDISPRTVDSINNGVEPFPGEYELEKKLKEVVRTGKLRACLDPKEALEDSDVIVVVVPLVIGDEKTPDFTLIDSASQTIGSYLKNGALVIYETTLPVGTTRERFLPILEKYSSLKAGVDFSLAFSPERVLTGRVFSDLQKYPKIVGGVDSKSAELASSFYSKVLDFTERRDLLRSNGVWNVGSCETAELVKLAETTYRDVNIGLANQFAIFARSLGIDISEVIEAANSQDYSHIHSPGIAVGGHCIPVYPHLYLLNHPEATIVSAGRRQNEEMPRNAINQITAALGSLDGFRCVILGISYRSGVKETAFSGSLSLLESLADLGVEVLAYDPLYSTQELKDLGFIPFKESDSVDFAILHNDGVEFQNLAYTSLVGCKLIYDGRRVLSEDRFREIKFLSV